MAELSSHRASAALCVAILAALATGLIFIVTSVIAPLALGVGLVGAGLGMTARRSSHGSKNKMALAAIIVGIAPTLVALSQL